ncbi:MAG: helix-turn-helix transcriptional regulator [Burkholderiaceae bacterium]|nr:helix-turn-helix transcriptional regulator [Burkholderiaceae bacterium]
MNIAQALKSEISRVARKEVRADTQTLKKASAKHRSEIAALKRQIAELERLVKRLSKGGSSKLGVAAPIDDVVTVARFSAKGLAAKRKKLGLSAGDFGKLIGASGQSVYKWEDGKTRPRVSQMAGIAAVRKMSKKQAETKLAELS